MMNIGLNNTISRNIGFKAKIENKDQFSKLKVGQKIIAMEAGYQSLSVNDNVKTPEGNIVHGRCQVFCPRKGEITRIDAWDDNKTKGIYRVSYKYLDSKDSARNSKVYDLNPDGELKGIPSNFDGWLETIDE